MCWVEPGAQKAINDSRKAARRARKRHNIMWKDAPAGTSTARLDFPSDYKEPPNLSEEASQSFTVGRAVVAMRPLTVSSDRGTYAYAPLEEFRGTGPAPIPTGSLLVYAGAVRETERKYRTDGRGIRHPCDVLVVKHTFITSFGRCVIHDFDLVNLVNEE